MLFFTGFIKTFAFFDNSVPLRAEGNDYRTELSKTISVHGYRGNRVCTKIG
jgi:hypothetical protein